MVHFRLKVPEVHQHVSSIGLPWAVVTTKWFICLFAEVLPVEVCVLRMTALGDLIETWVGQESLAYRLYDSLFLRAFFLPPHLLSLGKHFSESLNSKYFVHLRVCL